MIDLRNEPKRPGRATVPDGVLIVDRDGRVVYASDAIEALLGFPPAELVGRPAEILLPERLRACGLFRHPADPARQDGRGLLGLHRDGHELPIDLRLSPLAGHGLVVCTIRQGVAQEPGEAGLRDAVAQPERRLAASDAAVRAFQEYLRLFVENTPAAVAMLDRDMRYLMVSRRWLEDYALGDRDIIGLSHYEVFPELPESWKAAHRLCLAGQALRSEEDSFLRPGGKREWLRWEIHPWRTADGEIGGIIILTEVITRRKLAELELLRNREDLELQVAERTRALETARNAALQASAFKSRFLTTLSHDLRQPLQSILALLGVLGKRAAGRESRMIIERMDDSVGQIVGMIEALLDIGQIESGQARPEECDVPVAPLLARKAAELAPLAAAKGLELRIVGSSAIVRSDPRLLERMVGNLLSNAVKYTERGRILLGCRIRGALLRIEVWDTGIGLAPDKRQTILEELYRAEPRRNQDSGLGLGLYFVQRAAALLGHLIEIRSEPARGTLFALILKRVSQSHPAPQRRATPTILLVEDDPDQLRDLRVMLELEGYRVLGARSADEARGRLGAADRVRPELILCDYDLGGGPSGIALVRQLRAEFGQAIPALVLTGDGSWATRQAIAAAELEWLGKPVKASALVAAVDALVQRAGPAWAKPAAAPVGLSASSPVARAAEIGVVEDDPGVRDALRLILEAEGYPVATYASSEAFLADPGRARHACLVVDLNLPSESGLELQSRLNRDCPPLPIIFVSGQGDLSTAVKLGQAGAADFLQKPVHPADLVASVERALAEPHEPRRTADSRQAEALRALLTARERDVLERVLEGKPTKLIAAELGISERTAEHHRQSLMRKAGAKSLARLLRLIGPGVSA